MDIISIYNPANVNISPEEIAAMKDLTTEQIAELARAYPNSPNGNAYLVYYNTNEQVKDQRYPLGTWANLSNLRKLGHKHILPFNFFKKFAVNKAVAARQQPVAMRTVDLAKDDLGKIEGLKKEETDAPVVTSPVTNTPATQPKDQPPSPPIDAKLHDLQNQLQLAKDDKAHHMTIKSIEKQIDDHKETLNKTAG